MIASRRQLWLCAQHELVLAVRSRWLQTFAVVFAALVLLVSASGYILSGGRGVQEFSRTAISLIELVLLIIPLTAITFGITQLTLERGGAEILFSQPVNRSVVLIGRVTGLFLALEGAQAIGFGAAGLVVFSQTGAFGVWGFAGVMASAGLLTAVFLAMAALISAGATSRRRARVLAVGLVVWFAAVVLFDAAALGLASLLGSGDASRLLILSVFFNPVDAVRTGALLGVGGTTAFGAASLAFFRFTGGPATATAMIGLSLAAWIAAPLALAARRLRRSDI
jgi:Cu-processing system permease protein